MTGLDPLASELLCLTLLHSLWQVAAVALAAWVIGLCLGPRRENVSYVVHATALVLGLVAAPMTHALLSYSGSALLADSARPVVTGAEASAPLGSAPGVIRVPSGLSQATEATEPLLPAVPAAQSAPGVPADSGFAWRSIMPWLAGAYMLGVVVMLGRLAWSALLLERLRATARPIVDGPVLKALHDICSRWSLKTAPALAHAEGVVVPKVVGLLKPTILLPSSALTGLPVDDLELILAHELAHVRRHDLWINLVQRLAEAVLFFNPAVWWLSRRVSTLREYCCDDRACAVIPDSAEPRLRYAEALLHAVELHRGDKAGQAAALAASGRSPSELRRRVARLFGEQIGEPIRLSRGGGVVLAAGAALLLISPTVAGSLEADNAESVQSTSETEPNPSAEADDGLREMRISILDEEGQPLAGAKLRVGVSYPEGYDGPRTPKKHTADAEGKIALRLPKKLKILRLWPKQPAYVGGFKNFAEGTHGEGELLPEEFEFRLAKGHEIGGRVVDADGNPIQGVHVRVRVKDTEPSEMVSTWLTDSFHQPTVKTDADGRWRLGNAPAPRDGGKDCTFELKLSHDDYISDEHWGDAQRAQGITAADLRSGNATVALHRGKPVTGLVTDAEGDPVTRGWVVWSDTPYFFDGTWEAAIDEEGRFRTPPLSDGEHPITIVAPGFAAQRRVVEVGGDLDELRFELRPGKRIEIRVVDKAGNPIPQAGVWLANSSIPNTWQGSNALHNHKHPNVPDYGIGRSADESGVFVWAWAPEEPVRYSVGAKGYAPQGVTLVAKSDPHVITLADARVAFGKVTDASTGEPIKSFQAMPVIVFRPEFFSTRYADVKPGIDGRYELPLTGSGDPEDRYRVRFEAEGYRSVVSEESFGPQDGRVELNVRLEPGAAREGRVVDAEGEPVAGAAVLEGTPTWVPSIYNDKPNSYGERVLRTDGEGRFRLNATTEPVRVRVWHDQGVAERLLDPADESLGDLTLQPWAKVSGRLLQDGQPVGDHAVYYNPLVQRGLGEARFQGNYQTRTAADGAFSFERLPPGAGKVRVPLGPWADSPLTSAKGLSIVLRPGEERQIVLGGEGAVITGRVVTTGRDEAPLNRKWSLNYLVKRSSQSTPALPPDFPELGFDPSGPMQRSWLLDPHFIQWVGTRENHFVKLSPDGDLRVTGVSPGEYDLVLRLYEQPAGCLVETVGEKVVPVRVSGDGAVDLGQIDVPCRAGPRVGSDMRAYEFVDTTGRARTISDLAGRHVVLHVWATWCAPCLTAMPEIAAAREQLDGKPIAFVGLNVDADRDGARGLAERRGWAWAHNYLGDDSDLMRQLAISSVPTYYLVGPDGRLVAANTEWESIQQAIADAL